MSDDKKKEESKVEIQESSDELEALKERCEEFENGWKRALADYDNLKKDLSREKQQNRSAMIEQITSQILPVLDNFDQATRFQPEGLDDKAKNWLSGIMHVRSQLEDVLKSFGAEPFCQEGDSFDPHTCEAVTERHEPEIADQVILEVTQRGWKLGEKILRPAKVIINNLTPKT